MQIRPHFLAATAALALLAGPTLADGHAEPDANTVVATVNGTEITLGHVLATRAQLPAEYANLPADVLLNGLIGQLVDQQVLADTLQEAPARVQFVLDNEARRLRAGEIVAALRADPITEDDIQAAYDAAAAAAVPEVEFNASHILLETEEEAQTIKALLDDGGDFAALAQEHSTGPSGPNGGNLGWFGLGAMVAPFEEAVVGLEVGEVSDPVETQFGWHIVTLNDQRETAFPPIEQVRPQIEADIQEDRLQALLAEGRDAADVDLVDLSDMDPAIVNNLDLLAD